MKVIKTGILGTRSEYKQTVSCERCEAIYEFTFDDVAIPESYDDRMHPSQRIPEASKVECPECSHPLDVHLPDFKLEANANHRKCPECGMDSNLTAVGKVFLELGHHATCSKDVEVEFS